MAISDPLTLGLQHHQAGRLQAAEQSYRQVPAGSPRHPEALHLLGVLAHQTGNHASAVDFMERAIRLRATVPEFHGNLGEAYRALRRYPEAILCFQQALALKPEYAEAHNNWGNALKDQGNLLEAIACYQRALELRPRTGLFCYNLGNAFKEQGRSSEAIDCYRRALALQYTGAEVYNNLAIALENGGRSAEAIASYQEALRVQPAYLPARHNLGLALHRLGRLDEAARCYEEILALDRTFADAHHSLGSVRHDQARYTEAIACFQRALQLRPTFVDAHLSLVHTLRQEGRITEALVSARRALELEPDCAAAHISLGHILREQGLLTEALDCFRRALELKPDFATAHGTMLFVLHFCPEYNPRALLEEHRRWNELHARPLARFIQPHANEPSPGRRLRIGYVSPDFSFHPVGRFLLPLLQEHDRTNVQIYCYASVRHPDELTNRCRAHADVWRSALGLTDAQLAETIREDKIDILVDLTMHAANNRLLTFARKPAPVQVTYLAYCGTTGLDTIDYRLTDPYLDPQPMGPRIPSGLTDACYSEESLWLPETYWCYQPLIKTPEVNMLPALTTKHLTFGCLNNFCKVTEPTLVAWSRLLEALPEARLVLHAKPGSHCERVRAFVAAQRVAPERLTFLDRIPINEYFKLYERIDVALDPFPFGGGTTTCDALWMGVPVVSLAGRTAVGRAGVSILSNVGLGELVGEDTDRYVRLALELAGDTARLSKLRAGLRARMLASPLMDVPRFARALEAAYRDMWQRWCRKQS